MKAISLEQAIEIHKRLIQQTGGEDGVRDTALLESAILSPQQTFDGEDIYPSITEKAAQTAYQLINNHPFVDGNKRIGIHIMLLLLLINGKAVKATDKEKIKLGLDIAQGLLMPDDIYNWLQAHISE